MLVSGCFRTRRCTPIAGILECSGVFDNRSCLHKIVRQAAMIYEISGGGIMRIAIVGQRDFGKAAMEAFVKRGDIVAGVFCAPEKPGEAADPLRLAAEQLDIPVYALPSLRVEEARQALQSLNVESRRPGLCAAVRTAGFRDDPTRMERFNSIRPCCRAIADRARSIGPSSWATPAPASPFSGPWTGSMKARSSCKKRRRSAPTRRSAKSISEGYFRWALKRLLEAADLVVNGQCATGDPR